MGYQFEYFDLRYGAGVFSGPDDLTLLGRLLEGEIGLEDTIVLPTASGLLFVGRIIRFHESFQDWLGLPFYDKLTPESVGEPFCIAVLGHPPLQDIAVPGLATGMGTLRSGRS